MNEGWCFDSGEYYASTQEIADQIARDEYGYLDFKTMYADLNYDWEDEVPIASDTYWTTWDELDEDDYWQVVNGELINIGEQ
jgi:hypothetical protein